MPRRKSQKDIRLTDEEIKKMCNEVLGVWEVFDPKTGEIIECYDNSISAYNALWKPGRNLWNCERNGLDMRKVETDAAKVLYGNNK